MSWRERVVIRVLMLIVRIMATDMDQETRAEIESLDLHLRYNASRKEAA